MSWFGGQGAPAWWPLPAAAYERFVRVVRAEMRDHDLVLDEKSLRQGRIALPRGSSAPIWDVAAAVERLVALDSDLWPQAVGDSLEQHLAGKVSERDEPEPSDREPEATGDGRSTTREPAPIEIQENSDFLRTQIWSRENPILGCINLDQSVYRPVAGPLIEIAVWDLSGMSEVNVTRGVGAVCDMDDAEILRRGRTQAVAAALATIHWTQVEINGGLVEVAVSNHFYLSAVMLQVLGLGDPHKDWIAIPVSWHHWIVHQGVSPISKEIASGMRDFARRVLDEAGLQPTEVLGDQIYRWPCGGGSPEAFGID